MKSIKIIALLTLMTLFFTSGALAQDKSFHDSVEQLLVLMKQDQILNQVFEQIKPMVLQQVQPMNKKRSQIIDKYMSRVFDVLKDEMSWDKTKEDYIQIYMSVYTKEEIQELITFYQSPIGQKMIAKMPMLMQQSMNISQKHMKNIMPQIQEISIDMATEIQNTVQESDYQQ